MAGFLTYSPFQRLPIRQQAHSDINVEKHWSLQQRELLPTFTTFPFNPSITSFCSGNPTDTNEAAKILKNKRIG